MSDYKDGLISFQENFSVEEWKYSGHWEIFQDGCLVHDTPGFSSQEGGQQYLDDHIVEWYDDFLLEYAEALYDTQKENT